MLLGLKDGWQLKATNENCLITGSTQNKTIHENSQGIDKKRHVKKIHETNKTINTNRLQYKKFERYKTMKLNAKRRERKNQGDYETKKRKTK